MTERLDARRRRARRAAYAMAGAALAAACAPIWPTLHASSPVSPAAAYECAATESKAMGFTPATFNRDDRVLEARRQDKAAQSLRGSPDRQYEVLMVKTGDAGTGGGSVLTVQPGIIVRHFTREGWQEDRLAPTARARQAADSLLARCGGAAPGTGSNGISPSPR